MSSAMRIDFHEPKIDWIASRCTLACAAMRAIETAKALDLAGYKRSEAKAAAEQTRTHVGTADGPIEDWIKYALSRCGR